jgi:hypothetical protein
LFPILAAEAPEEVLRQEHHVIASLTQGRQVKQNDSQTEVQVASKPVELDLLGEVSVGGRQNTYVDLSVPDAAHSADRPFLYGAEQLSLE